jgi:hypothetical protein
MRAILLVMLGGCFAGTMGGGGNGGTRPAVTPLLSELPGDATKRDAVLDSAGSTAGPEQRPGQTRKERKAETAAATAAAIIGGMFSKTQSVTIGTSSTFDENEIFAPASGPARNGAAPGTAPESGSGDEKRVEPVDVTPPNSDLVPWIKLK